MSLGKKQEQFARLLPRLIDKAHEFGFEVRIGDLFRDPRAFAPHGKDIIESGINKGNKKPYGNKNSVHKLKLAVDLNLFKDGKFLSDTSDHKELGEWWEKQHPDCRWGGRFKRPDGNHYSITHWGCA